MNPPLPTKWKPPFKVTKEPHNDWYFVSGNDGEVVACSYEQDRAVFLCYALNRATTESEMR